MNMKSTPKKHTSSRNLAAKKAEELNKRGVELKLKIAETYLDELRSVSNGESALLWVKSIPSGIERELLLLIALNRL